MQELKSLCDELITQDDLILPSDLKDGLDLKICTDLECGMKIFTKKRLPISTIIPIFSDFSFVVISEVTFKIDDIYVTKLYMDTKSKELLGKHSKNIKNVLRDALRGDLKSGRLFELVYHEDFSIRALLLFRSLVAYSKYLIDEFNEKDLISCLVRYHRLSGEILDYFLTKFDPHADDRVSKLDRSEARINDSLRDVEDINDDRVLKLFFKIVQSITRSNFFKDIDTIAHKFDLTELKKDIVGIEPNIESFVYTHKLQGVHLRVNKVCRGGIRWSNRRDDFRVEIKSLMTTQEAKNAIIVPKGAKGGFVIFDENISKEEFDKYYVSFINALLDLVDNKKDNQEYHPDDMVCYDGYDSYFVVAADRGTSSMSDIANNISKERGFWLKDAFASGSSTGYHHKKLGVTAKGALRSAQRYFLDKGLDFYKESISVVGVGSMKGDVFGNGMLESKKFRLVGAISHDEIFIDPNPDEDVAFEERKRLFFTNMGKWSQYDQSKISTGGGVFKRSQKSIKLTKEIKSLLNCDEDILSAEEIAKRLLCLDVDMLYFGGIGTYVKASQESNISIGDKENEYIRVDASELKSFCICEGANLALSMAARIEYALNGGYINLDSIDNSAGVDTSDHEVNFKILLNSAVEKGKIGENERIQLLHGVSDFVLREVLETNALQSLAISLEQSRSVKEMKSFKKVVRILESELDTFKRGFFLIPKDRDFGEVVDDGGAIVRPILATIMLYSKIFLQDILMGTDIIRDSFYEKFLFEYFPLEFREKFKDEIMEYPLRDEIISMVVANKIINKEGSTFLVDYDKNGKALFLEKVDRYLHFS